MDFDHVPNPGIMSPQFLWCLKNRLKKEKKKIGSKKNFGGGQKMFFSRAMAHWNHGEMTIKTGEIMPGNYGLWP